MTGAANAPANCGGGGQRKLKAYTPQTPLALAARKKPLESGAKRKGQLRLAHTLGGRIRKRAKQVLAAEVGGRRSKRGGGCTSEIVLDGGQKVAVEVGLARFGFVSGNNFAGQAAGKQSRSAQQAQCRAKKSPERWD